MLTCVLVVAGSASGQLPSGDTERAKVLHGERLHTPGDTEGARASCNHHPAQQPSPPDAAEVQRLRASLHRRKAWPIVVGVVVAGAAATAAAVVVTRPADPMLLPAESLR